MKTKNVKRTKKNRDRVIWVKKNRGVPENREQARARLICRRRSV